jgi:hypothetical protein
MVSQKKEGDQVMSDDVGLVTNRLIYGVRH